MHSVDDIFKCPHQKINLVIDIINRHITIDNIK